MSYWQRCAGRRRSNRAVCLQTSGATTTTTKCRWPDQSMADQVARVHRRRHPVGMSRLRLQGAQRRCGRKHTATRDIPFFPSYVLHHLFSYTLIHRSPSVPSPITSFCSTVLCVDISFFGPFLHERHAQNLNHPPQLRFPAPFNSLSSCTFHSNLVSCPLPVYTLTGQSNPRSNGLQGKRRRMSAEPWD